MIEEIVALAAAQPTLVYRITQIENVPWILDHGLHCASSPTQDQNFVPIGLADLIQKRSTRAVAVPPGGYLSNYVPFYFCRHSRMMYKIVTGDGVPRVDQGLIVYLVTSVEALKTQGRRFLFTNKNAYLKNASYFDDVADLPSLDWPLLRGRDFRKDLNDPDKGARREAELLVHQELPLAGVLGIACLNETAQRRIAAWSQARGIEMNASVRPKWYF